VEQTVDRAASLAPAYDTLAARELSARLVGLSPPHERVLPLLPVRSARELAVGLARQWQSWSGAEAAVVAFGFVGLGRKFVSRSRIGELPQVAESAFDREQADAGFREFATSDGGTLVRDPKPVAALAFPTAPDAVGGVLLYARDRLELPGEPCEQFAAWSGRLLEQAAIVEQSLPDRRALEAAKADALAEFAAGAGHEINNPLGTIAGRIQILLRDETDGNRRQDLATIGAQALRVRDMIGDLMVFGRPPVPAPQRLLLNDVAQRVIDQFAEGARSHSIHLELAAAGPVFATADPAQLRIVLSELVRNSIEAINLSGENVLGEIVVRLERSGQETKAAAVVSISDNGPGLNEKDRAHLFDPFYSGRDAGRGLGFGLCKCWRIVDGHGGRIEVDSVPRVATTFRVFWPDEPARPPHEPCELLSARS
jgi:signal transduction histidine kinase